MLVLESELYPCEADCSHAPIQKATYLEGNFHELCKRGSRASVYRSPSLDARLHCRFLYRGDPYLRLAPFKMEERSEQPFVVAFHDFMSDSEVEHYKAEAVKNMIRQRLE